MTAPVILLMGPTATGKSALAVHLAQRFNGEIVSADSAQVYRGMDIGTAKPDAATRSTIRHHLLDLVDPDQAYSAGRFAREALNAIDDIRKRGRMPIVVGGTMLYFQALTEGLSNLPPADPAVRAQIDDEARSLGWPALHATLARVDAVTAARIEPTDAQRIQRALEVYRMTGEPLSALQGRRDPPELGRVCPIALVPADRSRLHRAIEQRFDKMLEAGLVSELAILRARFALTVDKPSMRAVGYRQAWAFLDGAIDAATLRARGIAATRQLAKRQLTWLRSIVARLFDPFAELLPERIVTALTKELGSE